MSRMLLMKAVQTETVADGVCLYASLQKRANVYTNKQSQEEKSGEKKEKKKRKEKKSKLAKKSVKNNSKRFTPLTTIC